jgi:hypothetical protein
MPFTTQFSQLMAKITFRPFRIGLSLALGLGILSPTAEAAVGDWTSYTHVNRVFALQAYQGWMFAGTQGGIRKMNENGASHEVFDNRSGLVDVWTVGFGVTGMGELWAISKDGCAMGNNWPSQFAQPRGAKFPGRILISATNGSDIK